MTENRRSGPTIVALANRIQSQIPAALPKNLAAEPGAPADRIECFLAADDDEEAGTIAADIVAAAEQGTAFAEQAVLCRKRRLIDAIVGALEARRVPVEVVGTSGLLDRPEIVDLVAWLEVLADPSATVALIRIWRGPRYRLGWRDLAVLARHIRALRQDRSDHEAAPFSLFDALTNLDDLAELSGAGRSRLALFRREHAVLARAARRLPVVDLAETIAAKTGLWGVGGERTRDNLLRFLELAEDFTPVEGRPGLAGFVEYLHLLGESEEELAEAHLGDRDAVAVMTIHQAKGLEWDCVWVPGLAGSGSSRIFPDGRTGENPLTQQTAVPWWLHHEDRGFGDWRTSSKEGVDDAVRRRAREEEWRLLYVACTRARRQLVCSAAQWYPGPAAPQGPSEFYRFISGQTDLVTERFRHEPADIDPQVAAMERRRAAADRVGHQTLATRVDQGTLFDPAAATGAGAGGAASEAAAAPTALSVTGLVSYRRCPRQYYWMAVRPLPRRASESARIGTEVHRWIEQRSGGQLGLLEPEPGADPIDPGDPTDSIDPAHRLERPSATVLAGLRTAFLATPYADLNPARVEAPFVLAVSGRAVRGRIDAVYRRDDRFELVDYKTGSPPEDGDKAATAQLDLYAVAANDLWGEDPSVLRTTYCYLHRDGTYQLVETDWDSERLAKARADLAASLAGVAAGEYDAAPGRWCARCEWQAVCRPGRTFLASIAEAGPGGPC